MTMSSTASRASYSGNGSTTVFAFPYRFLADADLKVYLVSSLGVPVLQVITTNYTVAGAGLTAGGTVTMLVAPPTGSTLVIYRDPALAQGLDLKENDSLPAEEVEKSFDKGAMISQRLSDRMDRAVRLPDSFAGTFNPALPDTLTADAVLAMNPTATGIIMGPTSTAISAAAANAAAAAASAAAALVSQSASAASAIAAAAGAAAVWGRNVTYVTSASSPVTLTSSDRGKFYSVDTSGGSVVFNLPSVAGLDLSSPFVIGIKKTTSTNSITINRASTDTIDGATSKVISTQNSGCLLAASSNVSPNQWTAFDTALPSAAPTIVSKTANYSALTTDQIILVSAASGPVTITLPLAATVGAWSYKIKKTDTSLNLVTVARSGADTIDGDTSAVISDPNISAEFISNGSAYYVF